MHDNDTQRLQEELFIRENALKDIFSKYEASQQDLSMRMQEAIELVDLVTYNEERYESLTTNLSCSCACSQPPQPQPITLTPPLAHPIVFDSILINSLCSCNFPYFRYLIESLKMDFKIIIMLWTLGCVQGQFFEDRRCRCVCPNPASVLNTTNTRQIYTGNVPPSLCHCEGVVLPQLQAELEGKLEIFCPRCECIFQTRNTTLIMATVFLILFGIVISLLYMASFSWLKRLIMRGRNNQNVDRYLNRPVERDYIREHRGEFQRERDRQRLRELELERRLEQQQRERERERNGNRNRALRDGSPDSEEEDLLRAVEPEN